MKIKLISIFLLISIFISSFCACSKHSKQVAESFNCFDTYCSLTVYCENNEFTIYKNEFEALTQKYHKFFDIYNSYENTINLKDLNERASLSPVVVSNELFDALILAKSLYDTTDEKFNIAIGSLTSIWHNARIHSIKFPNEAFIPTQAKIDEALLHTDINNLILDKENCSVFYLDSKLLLDFGAIAKGYVSSLLYERLISLGCKNFLINLGGNVIAYGEKAQNQPWLIKIENPFEDKALGYNETIKLKNSTLVTSGSYQRTFSYGEKQYSHIIDTQNGYPADIFCSVTVQAPPDSSALADALSTALFCMSYEDGLSLIETLDGVEALWIFKDGSFKATSDFGGNK